MRTTASGKPARALISRFTLYCTLCRVTGPVFAYRLSFGGRA